MNRRRFLKIAAGTSPLIAGCTTQLSQQTESERLSQTQPENPDTIFVAADGSNSDDGTQSSPLGTIQEALNRAQPGQVVRVKPGRYVESIETVRSGTPTDPITITGPPDAILSPPHGFSINHSHVHLTGLSLNGLLDPDNPGDPDAYAGQLIAVNEALARAIENGDRPPDPVPESEYLRDVVLKPHRLGNCAADFIKVMYSIAVEIGELVITGQAGAKYLKGDAIGHNSEFIYLGFPPTAPFPPDRTRDIHIHHIDNSAGHPHAELVDCKTGTSNILIEYCTDAGGSTEAITDDPPGKLQAGAIAIGGTEVTARWNIITNGEHSAIEIDSDAAAEDDPIEAYANGGSNNAIYGNQLLDNKGYAIAMPYRDEGQGQADQRVICGNEYNGETHGDPDESCTDDIPETDTIGHFGGDSPWARNGD